MKKKIIIDNKRYYIEEKNEKYVIYQYCYYKGIELPCFCYNENLEIAGNCRICLVEISTTFKLVLACATNIEPNMIIKTNTKRIQRVRQSIIEFLLINHPLDCPICDQGGECDLQNITQTYGLDRGRFYEFKKRSVYDKDSGFFIKTIMTRCIHCTRCVRFFKEIEGDVGFGIVARGEDIEIIVKKETLLSILSGNVVDMCPVGALTSKMYMFTARSWELNKYENIDILDSMCSTICIDLRNQKIVRILPATDFFLNNDWITNITRYFIDALDVQRLVKPYLIINDTFLDLSWSLIIKILINKLIIYLINNKGIIFFLGDFMDLHSLYFLKKLNLKLGYLNINLTKFIFNNNDFNFFYFFNTNLNNLQNYLIYLFIVLNLRLKMPLLNTKLRQQLKKKKIKIFSIGFISFDISFDMLNLGNSFLKFFLILKNKSKFNLYTSYFSFFISSFFYNYLFYNYYKKIVLFIGENLFFFKNAYKLLLNFCFNFKIKFNNIFVLFTNVIELHYQELYLKNLKIKNNYTFIYNLNFFKNVKKQQNSFSILQNSFFIKNIKNYNLILPVSSFFEYDGLFLNLEGRLRKKLKIYTYKNTKLKSNFDVIHYLSIILKNNFFFINFNTNLLKYFNKLVLKNYDYFLNFYKINLIISVNLINITFYYYSFFLENIYFFEYLINVYKYKQIYKFSYTLYKALKYFNTYINSYV